MPDERSQVGAAVDIPGFQVVDVVHQSGPRITYRAVRSTGEPVILKTLHAEYPHARDVAELRREYEVLQRLDIPGVVRAHSLVPWGSGNVAIEMEAFGRSLADHFTDRGLAPLPLDVFFPIAIRLVRTLGALHERRIVHKDVVPRNVLVDMVAGEVRLTDFGICSELSRERQSAKLSSRLEGSLPYISPEQTGRMSRDVDYRSDYYSLGVTFFEMLTGTLPFTAADPLEWVHRHISQPAPFAHEVNRDVPVPLSQLVAKLMAKSAEDRYQSTFGLLADLERCRDAVAAGGRVDVFALGSSDVSRTFQIPQALYGRERDLAQLLELFDDVAHGGSGLCLVSGYAGVGKSALVNEMGKAIVRRHGYLIEGKFDQFQRSRAYGAFATAFSGLVDQLLGEPEGRLADWRDAIRAALGANAQLIVELVPELRLVIGEQPPVADLPPAEAQNRFQLTFLNFVKVFATPSHPLVVFMDDLQWSDVPTLNLIARLATTRDMDHLFLIGAYRSNAVDPTHPLMVTLDQVRKSREVVQLDLAPLAEEAVDRLTADTLWLDVETCRPLSRLICDKAQGNPFFVKELLRSLHEDGAIAFSPESGRWSWDPKAVQAARVGANVVEFMVASLRRLPEATQQVLQLAACIGNTFDLRTLAIIAEQTAPAVALGLQAALTREVVVPLTDQYKYVGHEGTERADGDAPGANPTYRFQHDRVQQAAYALIDEDRKRAVHLSIGRLMRAHASAEDLDARLVDVVSHLNAGRDLIAGGEERRDLAQLNLSAGLKTARSSAYESALGFLRIGVELAGDAAWDSDHELMLALAREVQQCAYLTADYDGAGAWAETILAKVRTPLARADMYSARTRQYATMGRMRESIDSALAGLAVLGYPVNPAPTGEDVARELAAVAVNLRGRRVADLVNEPEIPDPQTRIAARLLMEVFAAAFLSGAGNLFRHLILTGVNLGLRHGASPESAFNYAAYGMLLCGGLDDPAQGYEYGRLGVAMNERFNDVALKARIIYVYAMFVHHWSNHWSSMTPWFLKGIEAGYQAGDMLYLAYSAQDCIIWDPKLDLATASQEQRKYLAIVKDCEYQDSYDSGTLFLQMQLNFQGLTNDRFTMNDGEFDEARCVDGMHARHFMTGVANYHIYKAEIHAMYGDFEGALAHVEAQDRLVASAMSLPQLVRFRVVAFLTRAALWDRLPDDARPAAIERLEADLARVSAWAVNCRDNFEHLKLTMQAELARIGGGVRDALTLYERAAAAAHASGFIRDEAVANELAARCLIGIGVPRAAEGYLRAAAHLFDQWGARRKVEQLESDHPGLREASVRAAQPGGGFAASTATYAVVVDSSALDMSSVIKASQTISGEIVVDQLLRTTLQILLENAGGDRGFFVVQDGGRLLVRAQVEASPSAPLLALPYALRTDEAPVLPLSVVNNVLRTSTPLVLNDASAAGRFGSDPYLVASPPKSVICVPIQRQQRFSGAIYIENTLTTGAFTEDRVEVIKLLAAQAAISVENARLYEDQLRLTEAQGRFVPGQFLEHLGHHDIAEVGLGEFVAREMSVMFADLRSFTPLAERMAPREVIDLLNRYFSRVGGPIADAGGFIDSYNGDELMALFPLPADRAVEAGVAMCRALAEFNRESAATGGMPLEMGLGVNSGPLVLGTVGSHDRLKCGVVGDTVNTASRIEQLTKRYRAPFLIGEHTFVSLRDPGKFTVRAVDRVAAKGKAKAITLYEVLDAEQPARRASKEANLEALSSAMERYTGRDFTGALEVLEPARARDPGDGALEILSERCRRYAASPPPQSWGGYESLESK